jgi:hypothetical protein
MQPRELCWCHGALLTRLLSDGYYAVALSTVAGADQTSSVRQATSRVQACNCIYDCRDSRSDERTPNRILTIIPGVDRNGETVRRYCEEQLSAVARR